MNWSKDWNAPVFPQWAVDIAKKEEQDIIDLYGTETNPVALGIKDDVRITADGLGQFTIKEGHKSYTFVGEVVGDLALDYADDGWNIYHVPTLQLCSKLVPCKYSAATPSVLPEPSGYEYSREALLNWMAKVQTNYPTSWQMLRLLTPTDYEGKGQSAKDTILEWCLSVKVE